MKTSKVKTVQQNGTWNSKHDNALMYNHDYEFEDGMILQASHKTLIPFTEGVVIEYEVTKESDQYGRSGTVKKPQEQFQGGQKPQEQYAGSRKPDKVQTYIIRQSSLKVALDYMNVDPNASQETFTTKRLKALAEDITNYVLNGL